jgi:uncharacterized OB-fold protein
MESGRCLSCGAHRVIKHDICKRCRMHGVMEENEEEN